MADCVIAVVSCASAVALHLSVAVHAVHAAVASAPLGMFLTQAATTTARRNSIYEV